MYATKTFSSNRGGSGGSRPLPNNGAEPTVRSKNKGKSDLAKASDYSPMEIRLALRIEAAYLEKITVKKRNNYELIAAFRLDKGEIVSIHVFHREPANFFELTERRRRLLNRYYQRGRQYVVFYLDHMQFENYMPVKPASASSGGSSSGNSGSQSGISSNRSSSRGSGKRYLLSVPSDTNPRQRSSSSDNNADSIKHDEEPRRSSNPNPLRPINNNNDTNSAFNHRHADNLSLSPFNTSTGVTVMSCNHSTSSVLGAVLPPSSISSTRRPIKLILNASTVANNRGSVSQGSSSASAVSTEECTEDEISGTESSSTSCHGAADCQDKEPHLGHRHRICQCVDDDEEDYNTHRNQDHVTEDHCNENDDEDDSIWKRGVVKRKPNSTGAIAGGRFREWRPMTVLSWLKTERKSRSAENNISCSRSSKKMERQDGNCNVLQSSHGATSRY